MRRIRLLAFFLVCVPGLASAHIHMTFPQGRFDEPRGDMQKTEPCGATLERVPGRVTTFRPGEEITVRWTETVDHPGWFRIAFQQNGQGFGIPPATEGATAGQCVNRGTNRSVPCTEGTTCDFPTQPQLGLDAANGSIVLADRIEDGTLNQPRMLKITLPDIECDNCTLQFIQVMTDKCPYTTNAASDDIYFNCADIVLSRDAPPGGGSGSGSGSGGGDGTGGGNGNGGGNNGGGGGNGNNGGGGNEDPNAVGGCSTSGTTGALFVIALFALFAFRRRAH